MIAENDEQSERLTGLAMRIDCASAFRIDSKTIFASVRDIFVAVCTPRELSGSFRFKYVIYLNELQDKL